MIGPFPTPPSSASTPPISVPIASLSDDQPPRKRARYDPPMTIDDTNDIPAPNGDARYDAVHQEAGEVIAVKAIPTIRRIRIKMSNSPDERRTPTRLSQLNQDSEEYASTDAEDDDTTTIPTQESHDTKESWDDYEIREMVEPEENWRVIGLSNVGNTCFSNAILQVFGYTLLFCIF